MSFFASPTITEHLVRGLIAFSALSWAFLHQENILASFLAFVVALIAFRGCPVCWSIGLVETLMQRPRSQKRMAPMADERAREHRD